MAMRATTMSPMTSMDTYTSVREPGYLFRKLVLLLLLVTAAALWIVVLFKGRTNFPLLLSTFFTDVSLGLLVGFGVRFVLQRRGWLVRFVVGTVLAIFGMILIGYFSDWVLGVGPIALEPKAFEQIERITWDGTLFAQIRSLTIDPRTFFDFRGMDWADPIHLVICLLMTVMALRAWQRTSYSDSPAVIEVDPISMSPVVPQTRWTIRTPSSSSSSNGRARIHQPDGWFARLRPSPRVGTRSNGGARSTVLKEAKKGSTAVRSRRKRSRRKAIEFALTGEHRCPYCLDPVTRTDARGVKECEVCHTLHHADCWAITGFCQVPHLNT